MSGYVNVDSSKVHDWVNAGINIRVDGGEDIRNALLYVLPDIKQVRRAIFAARSRSLQAGKALGARLAREEYTAKASKIKNRMKATMVGDGRISGLLFSGNPGLNLAEFLPRPNRDTGPKPKKGVTVKVKRKGPRYVPQGKPGMEGKASKPFIAKLRKNDSEMGIFVRYGRGQKRHMLFGPSPIQALQDPERQDKIRQKIEDVFYSRLNHELWARYDGVVK